MAACTKSMDLPTRRLVLVVDDDSRVRESLADLLSASGIEARCFSSAGALLDSSALADSQCVISDVRMPGIDGWELQRLVSAMHPHILIIFVSAFKDQKAAERAFALGAFAFLYKPFDGEELLRLVEEALSRATEA